MSGLNPVTSGLSVPFERQSTTANNLANLSTPGFKSSRVNAVSQVPTGTRVGSVTRSHQQGSLQRTGRPTDLAIQGDGFLVLRDGEQTRFTRSGSFTVDGEGRVVDSSSGGILQVQADDGGLKDLQISPDSRSNGGPGGELRGFSFDRSGTVLATYGDGRTEELATVALATFQNPGGLEPRGETLFTRTVTSGEPNLNPPGTGAGGTIVSGALESSSVDLAGEVVDQTVNQYTLEANVAAVQTRDETLGELIDLLG